MEEKNAISSIHMRHLVLCTTRDIAATLLRQISPGGQHRKEAQVSGLGGFDAILRFRDLGPPSVMVAEG